MIAVNWGELLVTLISTSAAGISALVLARAVATAWYRRHDLRGGSETIAVGGGREAADDIQAQIDQLEVIEAIMRTYSVGGELRHSVDEPSEGEEDPLADQVALVRAQLTRVENRLETRLDDIESKKPERTARLGVWLPFAGAIFVAVFTPLYNTLTSDAPKSDCVAYFVALSEARDLHPQADGEALFGVGGLDFDDLEDDCGPPEQFFEGLDG